MVYLILTAIVAVHESSPASMVRWNGDRSQSFAVSAPAD